MTAALNPAHPNFLAIQASVEADLARAVRKIGQGGEQTAWLRANSAAIRRAHAEMMEEGKVS